MQKLVIDALELQDSAGRNRLSISNGVISYDFRPAPLSTLASHPDRFTSASELLIRSAALRRDFNTYAPSETFWIRPLQHAEAQAKAMIDAAYAIPGEEECHARQLQHKTAAEADFGELQQALRAYAERLGLSVTGTRGYPDSFRVEIRIDPPKARIRFMPFLDYKRCMYFKLPIEEHWNNLNAGTQNLIGRYHYRAEWPTALNGPEEGNFDVTADTKLTFSPKAN